MTKDEVVKLLNQAIKSLTDPLEKVHPDKKESKECYQRADDIKHIGAMIIEEFEKLKP